jgi:protease I
MCVPVGRPGTMSNELSGKTIAFLATDGVEQVELTEPWRAIEEAGGTPHLVSIRNEPIQGFDHQDKAETFEVDDLVTDTSPDDFDALVLPGGAINPDNLRMDGDAVEFVRGFFEQDKPVAAICHGPWTLVEAGVTKGRTLTSWPSLRTDLENAGADWVDEEVHVDGRLITSRRPEDLAAFCATLVAEFAA